LPRMRRPPAQIRVSRTRCLGLRSTSARRARKFTVGAFRKMIRGFVRGPEGRRNRLGRTYSKNLVSLLPRPTERLRKPSSPPLQTGACGLRDPAERAPSVVRYYWGDKPSIPPEKAKTWDRAQKASGPGLHHNRAVRLGCRLAPRGALEGQRLRMSGGGKEGKKEGEKRSCQTRVD